MANDIKCRLDLDKVCRVCMCCDEEKMFLIFDEKYAEKDTKTLVADMLSELTMYKVRRFDEFPHLICGVCMRSVYDSFRFKRKCEKSYRALLSFVSNTQLDGHECANGNVSSDANAVNKSDIQAEKSTQTEDVGLYPCERCEAKYFNLDALRLHREQEHKGSAIICRFCDKNFNRISYLKAHIATAHPESGYKLYNQCYICKRQFTRRDHMRRHLVVVHKIVGTKYKTPEAKQANLQQLDEFVDLKQHCDGYLKTLEKLENSLETLVPLEQSEIFDNLNTLKLKRKNDEHNKNRRKTLGSEHVTAGCTDVGNDTAIAPETDTDDEDDRPLSEFVNVTSIKECIADALGDPLPDPSKLEVAVGTDYGKNINSPPPANVDQIMPKQSRRRGRPPRHVKEGVGAQHSAVKNLKCLECDKVFLHSTQFKRHRLTQHSDQVHKCEICNKNFTTKMYLQRHMGLHRKKRYSCKECSQCYFTKDELNAHIKSAGHDKPLLCPECGLRCRSGNILTIHMRRHTGEKPYKCKFCGKGFPRTDDLRIHEKYHTGEKSHFCETCGKGFQRKYSLTLHLRVHTGEKPHKCPHCPQAFAQRNDLKAHIRRHTGERFRCELCDAAFLQPYQIRQHKLSEHGIKEEAPTKRVAKFTSREEQEKQIQQNMKKEVA